MDISQLWFAWVAMSLVQNAIGIILLVDIHATTLRNASLLKEESN